MNPDVNGPTISVKNGTSRMLEHLLDSVPALIANVDCSMSVQFANKPFKQWFLAENVLGMFFPTLVGPEAFHQIQEHLGKVLSGTSVNFSMHVEANDKLRYLDVEITPEIVEEKVNGLIFHATDITEKHKSEEILRDYFENASIGLHWVNGDGIIVWANPAELRMLGYQEDEYIGHHIAEFHSDPVTIQDILERLRKNETIRNYEAALVCKDGSLKQVSINSSVLWEGGKFIHTRCFTIDITEQKRITEEIRQSEERFKTLADLVPAVIWTSDDHGVCNYLNVQWKTVTGRDPHSDACDQWIDAVHPDDRGNTRSSWLRSVSLQKSFEGKFRLRDNMGNYTIQYAHAVPRFASGGRLIGYVGVLHDISPQEKIRSSLEDIVLKRTRDLRKKNSDLKLAEEALLYKNRELERTNNELSSFAFVASHDLQEPLRKIQILLSRVLERESEHLSENGKAICDRIVNATERMRNLIDNLLNYSKANGVDGKYESVDLNSVLDEVISSLEIKIEEKNASVESSGLPAVNVVKFQFYQLFLNLINNALKFSSPDRRPIIDIHSEELEAERIIHVFPKIATTYHHIQVRDNGIGFDPQYNSKIFEIFQRLHGRHDFEGTGIGLSICKKIVENHQGALVAEGKVNNGATFHIYLPMHEQ